MVIHSPQTIGMPGMEIYVAKLGLYLTIQGGSKKNVPLLPELNSARAGLVEESRQYLLSSAAAHLAGCEGYQACNVTRGLGGHLAARLFFTGLEETLGRTLRPRKSGPKGHWRIEMNR